ncbi:hypothetical protein GW819_00725 [Candidatus Gracilibacteria bacterium]|nr:hypothetical protein [Candidatus Gracilibacteria bacterium]OIO76407.1 MAG: hypothetical protein AUJ87_03025 [Candidatus Gracilibacteria bacterium CG1_02_38_174]PIQ11093.1 MAG: hypothetical protein COW68_03260 [Candidatus Gracilibacteria bacterium CG18_big_fil_WC_8_21_14_2_50_38_16]PIQ41383.1 MAG: hypothetical protein COW06_03190 [Candidatus Gracilibacteria bacterium CG12_big_fil_rev_8_21_14_0_65_38_15]PIZ01457.1 MAG: hypothetical protein COY60_03485 [Candidatus Gracilibacteria bacterium CG_4
MRIASKSLLILFLISTFADSVFADSPFDIFSKYLPDIAVTNIYQETKFLYATVCNIGGTLTETENTLAIGIGIPGGGIISINAPIAERANNCQNYQITSIEGVRITTSGTYNITAAAILKKGRTEKTISNNKITRSLYISYPSKALAIPAPTPTYYNSNSSSVNCTTSNNYCNNNYNSSNIYNTYCNASNNYCNNTNVYNPNNIYCNSSNGYCSNNNFNGSANLRRSNICPPDDIACNDYFYNNSSNFYQNSSNYCNSSNNYCNNSNVNYNYNSSQSIYNTYCNASNNYCNTIYNTNYYNYCNSSNNYCNSYNSNY